MVDKYNKRKEEIGKIDSLSKEKELEKEKTEVATGIKVGLGVELPGLGKFDALIEHNTQRKN